MSKDGRIQRGAKPQNVSAERYGKHYTHGKSYLRERGCFSKLAPAMTTLPHGLRSNRDHTNLNAKHER
ncbi:hypothetical protein OCEANICA350_12358 [Oceanicaulis sp. 350]|nr:hypothetical protein OCEANICA350_12358 [Oceanicaulis sp. 350]